MRGDGNPAGLDGVVESHARHGLGLGRRQPVVNKLGLEPVGRMVLVGTALEVSLQLRGRGAPMSIVPARLGVEVAAGESEAVARHCGCQGHCR